jgi:hypothetical protein
MGSGVAGVAGVASRSALDVFVIEVSADALADGDLVEAAVETRRPSLICFDESARSSPGMTPSSRLALARFRSFATQSATATTLSASSAAGCSGSWPVLGSAHL